METAVRLIEQYRGGQLETIHFGHVCGVDECGEVIYAAGDPDWQAYLRSAAKPFQAIPAFAHGVPEAFGLTGNEKTIMTASHRAEPYHVEALEAMMSKIGLGEELLICAPSLPLSPSARDEIIKSGGAKRRLYHNCSGKHMGLLAYSKLRGYPLEGYGEPEHPAQQEVLRTIACMADYPLRFIHGGIDGCGLPVHALPLHAIARMFLKLACPDLIADEAIARAAREIGALMNEHGEMVSAPWFICSVLLKDPNIVAKGGAKGVYGFGLRKERLAFALKVLDGSEDAWPVVIASILDQIGYGNRDTIERLHALAPMTIRNDGGLAVGENKAVFELRQSRKKSS